MSVAVVTSIVGGGITINGSTNTSILNKITNVSVTYNKLWSSDTGRSVSGTMSGTLIGIFPTISIEFGRLNDSQAQSLATVVNAATQNITYYDTPAGTTKTAKFYAEDYQDKIVSAATFRKRDKITINFVAWKKRT